MEALLGFDLDIWDYLTVSVQPIHR
ncbi:hypothetical protein ACCAA_580045 [Candidatus Accumulibacter aalborgensis]|uniref:Uncharacterized protein n=1 Tax=Candidatus Accumulibacter aalborgensis TaxID=1860102 RepID=A0A1A8XU25_9PROT|nr:hypothetical protein ACCAA_580045 [Candidatus Accumulibacter aalborgensis]